MFALGKAFKYSMWACSFLFAYHLYIVKKMENPDEASFKIFYFLEMAKKADWHMYQLNLLLTRPPVQKLMPDRPPAPPGAIYPKVLVLNLRGTLIHSEYKFGIGFEVKKRPGLSMLINRLSRLYEIVIFSDEEQGIVQDICMALDPIGQSIPGRFGREATLLHKGTYVKDLSYLNRPIKDIVYVDVDDSKVAFHKENCLMIPFWDGNEDDRELYELLPFLESLGNKHGCDVRKEIDKIGRENTGKKYHDMMVVRRDMIRK